ncbi:MAG TPA: NAD(P)/FAD-dependent oxidoreductase [Tepidisphaeraceae bacterium]|nr:NAD(P)/FAD-dependent oxidoreductase [Tepidisphaeraceae bacterium]
MPDDRPIHIVILGGGFGGVYTALRLRRHLARNPGKIAITLVSRSNYFLMTPLLFEAACGVLEPRHAVTPLRVLLGQTSLKSAEACRFVEAEVTAIDAGKRTVSVRLGVHGSQSESIGYDHLVIALGGITNRKMIPGSGSAMAFKSLADGIRLRNHVIERFEEADAETDPKRKTALLTAVLVGGGLVNTELAGELSEFVQTLARYYPHVPAAGMHIEMIEAGPRIAFEFPEDLSDYAARTLRGRGVTIRTGIKTTRIANDGVELSDGQFITAATVVLAAGVAPNPLVATLPVERDKKGRIVTDAAMRALSPSPGTPGEGRDGGGLAGEPARRVPGENRDESADESRGEQARRLNENQNIWALGDCAAIPDPTGKPYPQLAQHALREARRLADNILLVLAGQEARPFDYKTKGSLAALGHFKGIGKIGPLRIHGLPAWWVWRSYYLFQMPRWSRRIRIMIDWTVGLFFKSDTVQLDIIDPPETAFPPATPPTQPEALAPARPKS